MILNYFNEPVSKWVWDRVEFHVPLDTLSVAEMSLPRQSLALVRTKNSKQARETHRTKHKSLTTNGKRQIRDNLKMKLNQLTTPARTAHTRVLMSDCVQYIVIYTKALNSSAIVPLRQTRNYFFHLINSNSSLSYLTQHQFVWLTC